MWNIEGFESPTFRLAVLFALAVTELCQKPCPWAIMKPTEGAHGRQQERIGAAVGWVGSEKGHWAMPAGIGSTYQSWNCIPYQIRDQTIEFALNGPELSPRELAVTFTDRRAYFVSESSVYRLLKAHDLIRSPAFIVITAADEFKIMTAAPSELWQTAFTYLKVIG